ncbi:hypothetical protein CYLTODRAFT_421687 [Cylindrobasidium torrendii FP15055 ss-10]|uniref:G-protein coupled receptors family 2 profile 2 domain-containing protein n=1 Tax=Cylindrobasidium torrendii FP15055 ss-10 TaxID=1314674 RepID=A0A0D7BCX3_9AGAR|nr:hypothetical protein CYLTODRAFT_421687 [Cylindrobasidium torrendii FP15055 ss-10]
MTFILATAICSPIVKRCATWYTFCASWIVSCLSYSLVFFVGGRNAIFQPTEALCVFQAALVYSVPILTALTTLALLVHSWYNVHFGVAFPPLESYPRIMTFFLVAPFIAWMVVFVSFLAFAVTQRSVVQHFPGTHYCVVKSLLPSKITPLIVVIITCSMLPIQASLAISLSQNLYSDSASRPTMSIPTLRIVVRVMIFGFLTLIAFGTATVHLFTSRPGEVPDILMAWLAVSAVLIFGCQRDIIQAWTVWIRAATSKGGGGRTPELKNPGTHFIPALHVPA